MLQRLLEAIDRSASAGIAAAHWADDIRTFLHGVDRDLDGGMPHLEIGLENRPILKLTLLCNRLVTTAHLESLPWLERAQRGLIREIRHARPRFHYGLKLLPAGRELEIYVHETGEQHFRRNVFGNVALAGLPDPQWLRAWALTDRRELSSYWADPGARGLAGVPATVLDAARETGCHAESWAHFTWNGRNWGPAKTGVQFVPASARLDAALRDALPDVNFLDLLGSPADRHSAHMAAGAGRHCLYMTLNRTPA